jgi:regulator of ribonuclease activity A
MPWSTPDLCDAHPDKVSVSDIQWQNFGGENRFCGEIVTVKCFEDNSLVKERCSKPGEGKILVVDGGGSMRCALLGDMIAAEAVKNAWAGLLIYGCVRDIEILRQLKLGVKALGAMPLKTEKRGFGDLNRAVRFGGLEFIPGQFLYADDNGVVVSAQALSFE